MIMNKKDYLIITFEETTMALYMERVCKEEKKDGRIIPLPKEIDAGCGLAWATVCKDKEEWKIFLNQKHIDYSKMEELIL